MSANSLARLGLDGELVGPSSPFPSPRWAWGNGFPFQSQSAALSGPQGALEWAPPASPPTLRIPVRLGTTPMNSRNTSVAVNPMGLLGATGAQSIAVPLGPIEPTVEAVQIPLQAIFFSAGLELFLGPPQHQISLDASF